MVKYPPLEVFDEGDRPIGKASLQEILTKGLIHRIVHVMVEDEAGRVLLQRRGPQVATNANKWDFSAAGYVDAGESYDSAARRELKEELGLHGFQPNKIDIRRNSEQFKNFKTNRFVATYKLIISADTPLKIEASEVTEVQWFDLEGLRRLLKNHTTEITPYTAGWLQERYFSNADHKH